MSSIDDLQLHLKDGESAVVASALSKLYTNRLDVLGRAGQDTLSVLKRL